MQLTKQQLEKEKEALNTQHERMIAEVNFLWGQIKYIDKLLTKIDKPEQPKPKEKQDKEKQAPSQSGSGQKEGDK